MLVIDVRDDFLEIRGVKSHLRGYQKLQLKHWGFKDGDGDAYVLNAPDRLNEILSYLRREKIDFSLSETAQSRSSAATASLQAHESKIALARDFKEGRFSANEYKLYINSAEGLIRRKLKDHQKKALYHLSLAGNGANFSVPGSGKTSVVLSYFEKLRQEEKVNTLFVIGPPACFAPWQHEYEEVMGYKPKTKALAGLQKEERLFVYMDTSEPCDLYLTTFQTLLNDTGDIKEFLSDPKVRALVVVDEAHYMKRLDGNWANAALNIARAAEYRCILTGTPMPKSYADIFNLMQFLWPDRDPIPTRDKARLQSYEEAKATEEAARLLDSRVGSLFYRVRKKDLALKPQVFNEPTLIKMNRHERELYDAIIFKIRSYAQQDYLDNIDLVMKLRRGRMIRARQSVSYAKLLASALKDYGENLIEDGSLKRLLVNYDEIERPAKMDALLSMIRKLQASKQKVVVWSNFIGTINLIQNVLGSENFYCKQITGSVPIEKEKLTSEETREKIRNEFVDPASGLDILIANPAACAESISLHKTCHHAIYYDLSYNLAQYLQSLDRIHRVGASEKQEAYYDFLVYEDTIDIDILNNLKSKAEKMYRVIDKDYGIYSLDMSAEDEDEKAYERIFYQGAES